MVTTNNINICREKNARSRVLLYRPIPLGSLRDEPQEAINLPVTHKYLNTGYVHPHSIFVISTVFQNLDLTCAPYPIHRALIKARGQSSSR
jgi:hypothetical protein